MLVTWMLLLLSLVVILVGCDLFTNGVEWAGRRLRLAEGAVGSVLAAVGTCLPETLIAVLAIVFGRSSGHGEDVGIGAILGAPLMLSTVAFFVTGLAVLIFARAGKRTVEMSADPAVLARDLRYFFIVFSLSAAAALFPRSMNWANYIVAAVLVALYVRYVRQTFSQAGPPDTTEDLHPLHFARRTPEPALPVIVVQSVAGLAVLVVGAKLFVGNLSLAAETLRIPALVLSLVITPIATELPEKFNSVIWVRQGKDTLALGNISGAMVFQSSIPTAIGLVFTSWDLDGRALVGVLVALVSAGTGWIELRVRKRISARSLLLGGAFYAAYLVYLFR